MVKTLKQKKAENKKKVMAMIKKLRTVVTQANFAQMLLVSQAAVAKWDTGKVCPRYNLQVAIEKMYNRVFKEVA